MHKTEQKSSREPSEILKEIAQKQREYYNAWEADWSRQIEERLREANSREPNTGVFSERVPPIIRSN